MKAFYVLFLLLTFLGSHATAQEKPSLAERTLTSVAKHQRRWRPKETKSVAAMVLAGYDLIYLEWETRGHSVEALIWVYSSVDGANEMFGKQPCELGPTLGGRMRRLDKKITGLDADNYIWEDIDREGSQRVAFRKGRVFVRVSAYSMQDATRLASYIIKELDP